MNPICKIDINKPECQRWMNEVYDRCRHLLLNNNAPIKQYSLWWLYETSAVYKDINLMTARDCQRLKRELDKEPEGEEAEEADLTLIVGFILGATAIVVLLLIWLCIKRQRSKPTQTSVASGPIPEVKTKDGDLEKQKGPQEISEKCKKRSLNIRKWLRRQFRPCMLHSENQIKEFELATERQVATHNERIKLKIALWTKAQERDAQRKLKRQEKQRQHHARNYNSFVPTT
ncbi:uncharacterized protein [Drosophila kikkawai]|uniref:Uncharacterized protein n=1 Tax=Drosophila kikkawai TaxID=30033 RepID=A0ABM3C5D6_DROKI|nr:uncharacterized protein LOC121502166 [Drosophila kikkawai]